MALDTTDLNAVAARVLGVATVSFVTHDGNATTSGTSLRAAITGASAGTVVIPTPGTYSLGSSNLSIPNGVHVRGLNRESVVLASTAGSGWGFTPGDLTTIEGVTLYALGAASCYGWGGTT